MEKLWLTSFVSVLCCIKLPYMRDRDEERPLSKLALKMPTIYLPVSSVVCSRFLLNFACTHAQIETFGIRMLHFLQELAGKGGTPKLLKICYCVQHQDLIFYKAQKNSYSWVLNFLKTALPLEVHISKYLERHFDTSPRMQLFEHMVNEGFNFRGTEPHSVPCPWSLLFPDWHCLGAAPGLGSTFKGVARKRRENTFCCACLGCLLILQGLSEATTYKQE